MCLEVPAVVVRKRRVELYLTVGSQHDELSELVLADHPLLLVSQSHGCASFRRRMIARPAIRRTGPDSFGARCLRDRPLRISRRRLPTSAFSTRYAVH